MEAKGCLSTLPQPVEEFDTYVNSQEIQHEEIKKDDERLIGRVFQRGSLRVP